MERKASLHNLGCKVNAYETEAMQQLLEEAGYVIVPFGEKADVCIINTCSVTNVADKKSRQMLHRARAKNPEAVVVAAGCYSQASYKELEQDQAVDIIIGNNQKKDLVSRLEAYFQENRENKGGSQGGSQGSYPNTYVIDIGKTGEYESLHIEKAGEHTRAFIKIQDGCNQFCSYCIIPYTRGRVRSRGAEEVLKEVGALAAAGCKEIVLTGIHLSSYGKDLGEGESHPLLALIQKLHRIPGLCRIRLGSLEPRIITREFAASLAALPKVCPHFHLSLQSGCEATLKRMNRHYTPEQYLEGCQILREAYQNPAITTDVIVGFPGETEEEFSVTWDFLQKAAFYEMHIFKYSRRAFTKAASMADQIPEEVKSRRSDILLELEKQMSLRYRRSFLGKENQVLLEEEEIIGGERYLTGFSREYVRMAVNMGRLLQRGSCGEVVARNRKEVVAGNCKEIRTGSLKAGDWRKIEAGEWRGEIFNGQGGRMLTPEVVEVDW